MTETAVDEEQRERIPWRRNPETGGLKAIFFYHECKQIWGTMTNTLGNPGNSARVFGIKGN